MKDEIYHALSNPYRRGIIRLIRMKTLSAGDIVNQFDLGQPTMSRHLNIMRVAGIINADRKANQTFYSLNRSAADEFLRKITELPKVE